MQTLRVSGAVMGTSIVSAVNYVKLLVYVNYHGYIINYWREAFLEDWVKLVFVSTREFTGVEVAVGAAE